MASFTELGLAALLAGCAAATGPRPSAPAITSASGDALVEAARAGDVELVRRLLADVAPDATNRYGFTALMWAAGQGREPVVQLLLARGAQVDARRSDGTTALMSAASEGQLGTAQLLLAAKADANARRHDGVGPLMLAASRGRTAVIQLLLAHGAELEARDRAGSTALAFAAGNPASEDSTGETVDAVNILLARGAVVDTRAADRTTPLMWAARKGEVAILEALLAHGASVDAVDRDGKTALIHAAEAKAPPPAARLLARHGASLDVQDRDGETALMKACRRKRPTMTLALVQLGANRALKNNLGQTAAMIAAEFGRADQVQALSETVATTPGQQP